MAWSCVFGLEDSSEQGPVHGPRLDGFGAVGAVAVHALLADVNLPAAEIGGGWFHGLGVGVRQICELAEMATQLSTYKGHTILQSCNASCRA